MPQPRWRWLWSLPLIAWITLAIACRPIPEGWETLTGDLLDTTLGRWVETRPPTRRGGAAQATFWGTATDPLLQQTTTTDAALHAAAAMVLDHPTEAIWQEAIRRGLHGQTPDPVDLAATASTLQKEELKHFENIVGPRASKHIERALSLQPTEPRWRRFAAVMTTEPPTNNQLTSGQRLRNFDWRSARQVDPGNALYDLLQASHLTTDLIDYQGDDLRMVITDPDDLQATVDLVRSACQQPSLRCEPIVADGLTRLLDLAGHPRRGRLQAFLSYETPQRVLLPIIQVARTLARAATAVGERGETERREELQSLAIELMEFVVDQGDETLLHNQAFTHVRWMLYEQQLTYQGQTLADLVPGSRAVDAYEIKQVLPQVAARPTTPVTTAQRWATAISMVAADLLHGLIVATLCLWLCQGLARFHPTQNHSMPHLAASLRVAAALTVGTLLSVTLWGTGPADQLPSLLEDVLISDSR